MKNKNNNSDQRLLQVTHKCCLGVSLYNSHQEGLPLASTYNWINSRFSECVINLGDTLHRYNLRHKYSNMEQAHEAARKLGDQWLQNNKKYLSMLKVPYKILRNDDWLANSKFSYTNDELHSFYKESKGLRDIVKEDIETFVKRRMDLPEEIVRKSSILYLLEEISADMLLGRQGKITHLYPGYSPKSYEYLVKINEDLPESLKGLDNLTFKRLRPSRMALKPSELAYLNITYQSSAVAA